MKKIVVMGGGNGGAKSIRALKRFVPEMNLGNEAPYKNLSTQDGLHSNSAGIELSAVISVSDSGGSSGRLRREFGTLPTGDILRAALAMSRRDYEWLKPIFYKIRFADAGRLDGHNLGNLFLTLAGQYAGDFMSAVRAFEQAVEALGHVYPATLAQTDLAVELSNGEMVRTEGAVDRPKYDRALRIKRAWLEPAGEIYDRARVAIEAADYLVLGPGSLYCSIVATLLPEGVREAIARSRAKIIYVAGNAHELHGETGPTRLSDFVRELQVYLPRKIDLAVYNNHELTAEQKAMYAKKSWGLFAADLENLPDYEVLSGDYERDEVGHPGLSDTKLGEILRGAIFQE